MGLRLYHSIGEKITFVGSIRLEGVDGLCRRLHGQLLQSDDALDFVFVQILKMEDGSEEISYKIWRDARRENSDTMHFPNKA